MNKVLLVITTYSIEEGIPFETFLEDFMKGLPVKMSPFEHARMRSELATGQQVSFSSVDREILNKSLIDNTCLKIFTEIPGVVKRDLA